MLLKLEVFQYDASLDLNMGYYNIRFIYNVSNLCMIIIPWGKYQYKRLPMGIDNPPDILQQNMNDLYHGFELIHAYIYDLLILTKGDWTDYVHKSESTLTKLKENELNIILKSLSSDRSKWNILGLW